MESKNRYNRSSLVARRSSPNCALTKLENNSSVLHEDGQSFCMSVEVLS